MLTRLAALADDADALLAAANDNPRLPPTAVREVREALALLAKLGPPGDDLGDELRLLASALKLVLPRHPTAASDLIEVLAALGGEDVAAAIVELLAGRVPKVLSASADHGATQGE